MDRSSRDRIDFFNRELHPKPIRADYYDGDKILNGSLVQEVNCAVTGVDHKTKTKGILAGSFDNNRNVGVGGKSEDVGVLGVSENGNGICGYSKKNAGVFCKSEEHEALHAETNSYETAAIAAYNLNNDSNAASLYAKKTGKGYSAVFNGKVNVMEGDLEIPKGDLIIKGINILNLLSHISHMSDLQNQISELRSRVQFLEVDVQMLKK